MQNFFDYCIRQIELSIREVGYGDATINKKMKDYINILFSIIEKIDLWEAKNDIEKKQIFEYFIDDTLNTQYILDYFKKYSKFLLKNSFNNLSKDIIIL